MDEERHHLTTPAPEPPVVCGHCGTPAPGQDPPPTWLYAKEDGASQYFCEDCSRMHIRAIESRLDSVWW
ncbi:hypothetical protein [uncultured Streptomyces sp.]|uniref:hypothetical protein n=1 Tax=uncultured Streptomyces sp. TaxID=174707 RepID=UPI002607AB9D|nr:hypothetical protein [uncultured Streptomyces sp.]